MKHRSYYFSTFAKNYNKKFLCYFYLEVCNKFYNEGGAGKWGCLIIATPLEHYPDSINESQF